MVPESYKIAYAVLDAVWKSNGSESLAILLGGMAILPSDDVSMDPGSLSDWQKITTASENASQFELILAYLDLDASRYREVPDDLRRLIDALRKPDSQVRKIADSVIGTWRNDPGSWPLYAKLTKQ